MLIINGVEVLKRVTLLEPSIKRRTTVYTGAHTVTRNQSGHTLAMNSSSNLAFTLFAPTAADVGFEVTFVNINTGRLTILVAGSGVVIASDGTEGIYSDDDKFATLTLRLVSATQWSIVGAHGTWTTSQSG